MNQESSTEDQGTIIDTFIKSFNYKPVKSRAMVIGFA